MVWLDYIYLHYAGKYNASTISNAVDYDHDEASC